MGVPDGAFDDQIAKSFAPYGPVYHPSAENRNITHGGKTWALVLAAGPDFDSAAVTQATRQANRVGYWPGVGGCDAGAAQALGVTGPEAQTVVDIYFETEADAQRASDAFAARGENKGVVAEVETYCLD